MAAHDDLLQCTYGSLAFQLSDYTYAEEPVMKDGVGRVGTKTTVTGKGWIEGTDPADFTTKIAEMRAGFRVFARDFRVIGLGGTTEVELLAAYCKDYGPHVSFKILEQGSGTPLIKEVEFTAVGTLAFDEAGSGGIGGVSDGFGVSVELRSDGLRRVIRKGVVGQTGASTIYQNTVLPAILAVYPATNWVASQRFENNQTDTYLTYEISFEEIRTPFLSSPDFVLLDGDLSQRVDRDEQHRKQITLSFEFAYFGDVQKIITALRPTNTVILRERWEEQRHKESRVRGEITYVQSADGNALGIWEQSIDLEDESPALSSVHVPGRTPSLYYGQQPTRRVVQSGRAVGFGGFVKQADAIWPARLAAPRKVGFRKLNDVECETTWRYEYLFEDGAAINPSLFAAFERPTSVTFVSGGLQSA